MIRGEVGKSGKGSECVQGAAAAASGPSGPELNFGGCSRLWEDHPCPPRAVSQRSAGAPRGAAQVGRVPRLRPCLCRVCPGNPALAYCSIPPRREP